MKADDLLELPTWAFVLWFTVIGVLSLPFAFAVLILRDSFLKRLRPSKTKIVALIVFGIVDVVLVVQIRRAMQ
jgi:hypothetical protein